MSASPQAADDLSADRSAETLPQDEAARQQALAASAPQQNAPAEVPGYDVQRCLGSGAYGSVWLAVERNTGKQVAIKFYTHRRGIDWSLLNREVEKLALLYTSREIVGLLEVGWEADPPYYIMEYLQNGSLSRMLDRGPLPVPETVRIATAVAGALVHAHAQGVLHCDVKPANVLLDSDFAPRLADFGQSRLSYEQTPALGTLFYMAPEQADLNAAPDPRWDVYALGALLYHMLCGEPPFRTPENERRIREAGNLEDKLAAYRHIVETEPRPAAHRAVRGVDTRLAEIVDRCLTPNPSRRFPNASAVAEALAARDRYRSLRPAIALGIVLPGLLLLALFPLAILAVRSASQTAEINIADRALESDAVAAKILAYSLNDDLDSRLRLLSENAKYPDFLKLVPGMSEPPGSPGRTALQDWLSTEKARIDEIRRNTQSDLDSSWFLTDAQGFQRWRDPPSEISLEENWRWRDYFHGQGADHPEWRDRTDIPPLTEPYISAPFRSASEGTMKLALSVPVRTADGQVVAVLTRTIELGRLLSSYKALIGEAQRDVSGARIIALYDIRDRVGHVLDHPWMTSENLHKLQSDEAVFDRLKLDPEQYARLAALGASAKDGRAERGEHIDDNYQDPIRQVDEDARRKYGMPWLAAFWPVGDTGLVAAVQEKRDEMLAPVREIRDGLYRYAALGLLLCITLVVTSWYFVQRVVRSATLRDGRRSGAGSDAVSLSGSLTPVGR